MPTHSGELGGLLYRDTIAALSSAPGKGAIAVVRLSGAETEKIVRKIFRPKDTEGDFENRKFRVGRFVGADGGAFDEGMAVMFFGPGSYTGENMAELYCHGGPGIVRALLVAASEAGARSAGPGEFTKRAFLAGKIDLLQCESVADLVSAETRRAAQAALSHLDSGLSKTLESIWEKIVEAGAHLEAAIDFPDEFEPGAGPAVQGKPMDEKELARRFMEVRDALEGLEKTYNSGRILREGARMAILGRSNAGKSTLLNRLLGEERAIMSPTPGTTRDTVEEVCDIGGIPVRLIDTAGIRETGDPVELEGTKRARRAAAGSDICLVVVDAAAGPEEVRWANAELGELDCPVIMVANKMDLPHVKAPGRSKFSGKAACVCPVSALTGEGIENLKETMASTLIGNEGDEFGGNQLFLARERHRDLVVRCKKAIERGAEGLNNTTSPELVAVDLNEAQRALSELLGRDYGQALLDKIFSTFCIGK